jgi:hypothetical protein
MKPRKEHKALRVLLAQFAIQKITCRIRAEFFVSFAWFHLCPLRLICADPTP